MDLDDVRRDWTRLGEQDPLWAVLVEPGKQGGRWDPEEFLATGRAEVDDVIDHLRSVGWHRAPQRVLDFGSGAGRLTQALRRHADEAVGVDISEPMLAQARRLDPDRRCAFVLNTEPNLAVFDDDTFDLAYSSLVLQHMPRPLALDFLRELARVVRPGGAVVVQVAATPTLSLKGLAFRWAPQPALRWAQTRLLGYPAPMRMEPLDDDTVAATLAPWADVVDVVADDRYGGHWTYHRHFAVVR